MMDADIKERLDSISRKLDILAEAMRALVEKALLVKAMHDAAPPAPTQGDPHAWVPDKSGWVQWGGGDNPVPGALVETLLRSEREDKDWVETGGVQSEQVDWPQAGGPLDVVAYKVVS